jgi:hypothetical protein
MRLNTICAPHRLFDHGGEDQQRSFDATRRKFRRLLSELAR